VPWWELATAPAHRHSVMSVVADHLLTVRDNHLALPAGLRTRAARDQLTLLSTELTRVRGLAHAGGGRRVEVQGLFLTDKFARGEPPGTPVRVAQTRQPSAADAFSAASTTAGVTSSSRSAPRR